MSWRPAPSRGSAVGLGATAVAVAVATVLALLAYRMWPGPRAAVLAVAAAGVVPVALRLAYWTWGRLGLRYALSRDALVIHWAAHRQVVPMDHVTHILNGRPYSAPVEGLRWPGHEVGRTHIDVSEEGGEPREALVYATVPPEGQLLIVTPSLVYAISPADRAGFVEDFRVRRRLGVVQPQDQRTVTAPWLALPLWHDDVAVRLLAVALVVNVLAWAWLIWHLPGLPAEVSVGARYDPALGEAVASDPQPVRTLFWLPSVGAAVLAGNLLLAAVAHAAARHAARLLVLGAVLVQLAIAVSLLKLQ